MPASSTGAQLSDEDRAARVEGSVSAIPNDHPSGGIGDFLIARGGPFHDLQQRLGLLHERALT